jgi:hypothetical protein
LALTTDLTDDEQAVLQKFTDMNLYLENAIGMAHMVIERHPEMRETVQRKLEESMSEVMARFQHWIDLAEGTITAEEFERICNEQAAEEWMERERKYESDFYEDEGVWVVSCSNCYSNEQEFDELPPAEVLCDDCQADADEELRILREGPDA